MIKALIILVMLIILGCLASGLFHLVRDRGQSTRTVKALTWRIGLSLSLFILLMLGFAFGIISPHPL